MFAAGQEDITEILAFAEYISESLRTEDFCPALPSQVGKI
jgi:hypothetical protein